MQFVCPPDSGRSLPLEQPAIGCLVAPVLLLVSFSFQSFLFGRLALSAFGLVAGFTILWSLLPHRDEIDVNGVLIDLSKETRLAKQIESINKIANPPGMFLGPAQREARAWDVLYDALVTCLIDHGWTLVSQP